MHTNSDDTVCHPIILNVCGNVTDIESVGGDSAVSNSSLDSAIPSISTSASLVSNVHTVRIVDQLSNTVSDKQNPPKTSDMNDSLIFAAVTYMNSVTNDKPESDRVDSSSTTICTTIPPILNHDSRCKMTSSLISSLPNAVEGIGHNQVLTSTSIVNEKSSASITLDASITSPYISSSTQSKIATSNCTNKTVSNDSSNAKKLTLNTKVCSGPCVKVVLKGSKPKPLSKANSLPGSVVNSKTSLKNWQSSNPMVVVIKKHLFYQKIAKAATDKIYNKPFLRSLCLLNMPEIFATTLLDPTSKPKKSWGSDYVCLVCGDEFHNRVFFNHHFTRKVFELDFNCSKCERYIRFNNKCNFWLHQTQVHSSTMDKALLEGSGSSFVWKPYVGPSDQKLDFDFLKKISCRFCDETFDSYKERKFHYQRVSLQPVNRCKICYLAFSNPCAFAAHCSIHEAGTGNKITCPECGVTFAQSKSLASVFEHLDSCYHFNAANNIKCECGQTVLSRERLGFSRHLIKCHIKMMLRCNICDCQCSSLKLMEHHYKQHTMPASPSSVVYCTLCRKCILTCFKLKGHVNNHVKTYIPQYCEKSFLCFLCEGTFSDTNSLDVHVEKQHNHKPKRCTLCFGLFGSRQKLVEHIMSKTCSSKQLPSKFHVCLDKPLSEEVIDWNIYNALFNVCKTPVSCANIPTSISTSVSIKHKLNVNVSGISSNGEKNSIVLSKSNSSRVISSPLQKERIINIVPEPPNTTQKCPQVLHISNSTQKLIIAPKRSKKKFQCHACKIILLGTNRYADHLKLHETFGGARASVEYCEICTRSVDNSLFQSHMVDHQKRGIIVCSLCHSRQFNTMSEALQHSINLCFYKVVDDDGSSFLKTNTVQLLDEHAELDQSFASGQITADVDMQLNAINEQESSLYPCEMESEVANKKESSLYPCLLCGFAFSNKEDKEDHVSRIHDGTRTLYYCLVCKKKGSQKGFSKKFMLIKHISQKHRIVNLVEIVKFIHEEEQNVMSGKVVPTSESNVFNHEDAPSPKRLRLATEGEFVCGKCGYSTENANSFQDHIGLHNPQKEPQCHECGLCFTVLAALKKHVFVVHKIKEIDQYLKDQGMFESESEEDEEAQEESIDISDFGCVMVDDTLQSKSNDYLNQKRRKSNGRGSLECTVCYRSFSSLLVLRKHMRNHGMAFIHSKRHDQ